MGNRRLILVCRRDFLDLQGAKIHNPFLKLCISTGKADEILIASNGSFCKPCTTKYSRLSLTLFDKQTLEVIVKIFKATD